jgi:hypothetical protein
MLLCSSVAKDTRHTGWPTINPTGGALDQIEQGVLAGLSVLSRDEWTGVKDENDVAIFENDIVECRYGGTAKIREVRRVLLVLP